MLHKYRCSPVRILTFFDDSRFTISQYFQFSFYVFEAEKLTCSNINHADVEKREHVKDPNHVAGTNCLSEYFRVWNG